MKKFLKLSLLCLLFMVTSCRDTKKEEADAKVTVEQVEAIENETEQVSDELEKEAKELENELNELDNI